MSTSLLPLKSCFAQAQEGTWLRVHETHPLGAFPEC
jgi:hypothetical protein